MSKEFELRREGELPGTAQDVWDAITTGTAGWLWPMEFEPRVGGAAAFGGTVTVWEPPHHFVTRVEGEDGWFNQLEHIIEARDGGTTWCRYVHSGVFTDDWDNQYDGADKHTDFYLHTLGQYLKYFTGRPANYTDLNGPPSSMDADAFVVVARSLGLADAAVPGDRVGLNLPGPGALDAVIDYRTPYFIGLRTDDAMYRFFGRNAFGAPVGISVHHFGGADQEETQKAWQSWLDGVFA
jgi:hypothetical protein